MSAGSLPALAAEWAMSVSRGTLVCFVGSDEGTSLLEEVPREEWLLAVAPAAAVPFAEASTAVALGAMASGAGVWGAAEAGSDLQDGAVASG